MQYKFPLDFGESGPRQIQTTQFQMPGRTILMNPIPPCPKYTYSTSYKAHSPSSNVTTSRCSNAFPLSNSPVHVYPEFRAAMRQSSSSTGTPKGRL